MDWKTGIIIIPALISPYMYSNYNKSLKLYRTLRHDNYSEVVITVSE